LAEIVKAILEPSQNWMAEQLVRTLGAELGRKGSWEEGFGVEQEFLSQEVGVDSLDITYQDGSGLSAYNLVTPRAMVRILEYMRDSSNSGIFRNALASPGEEESTLRNRLLALESRVFAKTGSITHVNALSGYVFTDSGKELIFSILTNGSGLPPEEVRAAIDRVTEAAARR
jgi:D-alanyl-D-alanine carboxypeptidase/D-alanyl-D-alanine-endopeptidase (penicillin-binding protein 4)